MNRQQLFNRLALAILLGIATAGGAISAVEAASTGTSGDYKLLFKANLVPAERNAEVSITLSQSKSALRYLDFNAPASRYHTFTGDGEIEVGEDRVRWVPPENGGTLSYTVTVDRLENGVHQARLTREWGVFRLGHLFPPARVRMLTSASGEASLQLEGPPDWRFETPYGPSNQIVHSVKSERRYPRPVGWAVAGRLGIRRDRIADRRVAVAAPVGEGFRRQDTLAFLRWTLPTLIDVFPTFPERLLVVGSGQDMWRGGLSGPASIYLHPERPLVSGNATSTLLHELVHVAVASTPENSDDWLVEGLAEYYSLELLRRTGGISQRRFDAALAGLKDWADRDNGRLADPSTAADTAYSTLLIHDLSEELRTAGGNLDSVLLELLSANEVTGAALQRQLAAEGTQSALLDRALSE